MSFLPVLPLTGYAGWTYLNRTSDAQKEAHRATGLIARETKYFEETIAKISTAEELVSDRTLLRVALGAFGLDADLNNKFFIRKVLEEGGLDSDSLANKLSDKRYLEFTKAFGFGDFSVPRTKISDFGKEITSQFKDRQFEVAVGDQSENLRLALGLQRDLSALADRDISEDSKWFTVMGTPPLRSVFESAFGLPSSFALLDIDKQLEVFKEKAKSAFGSSSVSQFSNKESQEDLVRMFLVRSELQAYNIQNIRGQTALILLQNSR